MTEIFPSPSSSASSSDCGSIVSAVVRSQGSSKPTSSLSSKRNSNINNEALRPPPSPRAVCRAWKIKRREQRRRALEGSSALSSSSSATVSKEPHCHQEQLGKENTMPSHNNSNNWTEREMQCHLKQSAFHIQRNFEQTAQGDVVSTSTEEDQSYRYEKYGSRAYFIQEQEGRATAHSKKRLAMRMRGGAPLEQRDDTQDRA
jgi:hypothetical protein